MNCATQGFQINWLPHPSRKVGEIIQVLSSNPACEIEAPVNTSASLIPTTGLELFQEGKKHFILCCQLDSQQLRPPQVFHAVWILTHCGTQKPSQNIMQRSSPQIFTSNMQNTSAAHLLLTSAQQVMALYPTFSQAMPSIPDHLGSACMAQAPASYSHTN